MLMEVHSKCLVQVTENEDKLSDDFSVDGSSFEMLGAGNREDKLSDDFSVDGSSFEMLGAGNRE